jgi:serine/threonine-protein kinase RsbW
MNKFALRLKPTRVGPCDAFSTGREAIAMARIQTVGGRSGLQAQFAGHARGSSLEINSWIPSEMKAISPLVDRVMRLIEGSRCVPGEEPAVELALREAVSNAVVHGNRMDAHKLVQIRCRCELGKGLSIIVKDQGQGFDPNAVPDSLAAENLRAEHGRGIYLMKTMMDTVSFERGGAQVRLWKGRSTAQEQSRKTRTNPSPRLAAKR